MRGNGRRELAENELRHPTGGFDLAPEPDDKELRGSSEAIGDQVAHIEALREREGWPTPPL